VREGEEKRPEALRPEHEERQRENREGKSMLLSVLCFFFAAARKV